MTIPQRPAAPVPSCPWCDEELVPSRAGHYACPNAEHQLLEWKESGRRWRTGGKLYAHGEEPPMPEDFVPPGEEPPPAPGADAGDDDEAEDEASLGDLLEDAGLEWPDEGDPDDDA